MKLRFLSCTREYMNYAFQMFVARQRRNKGNVEYKLQRSALLSVSLGGGRIITMTIVHQLYKLSVPHIRVVGNTNLC